jgi:hypothetical protein
MHLLGAKLQLPMFEQVASGAFILRLTCHTMPGHRSGARRRIDVVKVVTGIESISGSGIRDAVAHIHMPLYSERDSSRDHDHELIHVH